MNWNTPTLGRICKKVYWLQTYMLQMSTNRFINRHILWYYLIFDNVNHIETDNYIAKCAKSSTIYNNNNLAQNVFFFENSKIDEELIDVSNQTDRAALVMCYLWIYYKLYKHYGRRLVNTYLFRVRVVSRILSYYPRVGERGRFEL